MKCSFFMEKENIENEDWNEKRFLVGNLRLHCCLGIREQSIYFYLWIKQKKNK